MLRLFSHKQSSRTERIRQYKSSRPLRKINFTGTRDFVELLHSVIDIVLAVISTVLRHRIPDFDINNNNLQ
jgi:hypothetical protein